jgi:hypothetical protein
MPKEEKSEGTKEGGDIQKDGKICLERKYKITMKTNITIIWQGTVGQIRGRW